MRPRKGTRKKRCGSCERLRSVSCFAIRCRQSGRLQAWCRGCRRVYDATRYEDLDRGRVLEKNRVVRRRNREHVQSYLSQHPCVDCGQADPIVLEFDHVRGVKSFDIATGVGNGLSLSTIDVEIAKCDVRCANCHRRRTYNERGAFTDHGR